MHITHPATGRHGHDRHRRRRHPDRQRPRARGPDGRPRPGDGRELRRRRQQHRRLPRGPEHGRRVEAARRLRVPEQPVRRAHAAAGGHRRSPASRSAGMAYDMPAVTVDGNDPVDMWRAAGEAVARARAGEGPTLDRGGHLPVLGSPPGRRHGVHAARRSARRPWRPIRCRGTASGSSTTATPPRTSWSAIDAARRGRASTTRSSSRLDAPQPDESELTTDVFAEVARMTRRLPGTPRRGLSRGCCPVGSGDQRGARPRHGLDPNVFLLGEDIAEPSGGVYKITKGLSDEVRHGARAQDADRRAGHRRRRRRRGHRRQAARGRDHDHGLPGGVPRPGGQPRGQDPLHVRRPDHRAARHPHLGRRRHGVRRPALRAARGAGSSTRRASRWSCPRRRPTSRACCCRPSSTTTRCCSSR